MVVVVLRCRGMALGCSLLTHTRCVGTHALSPPAPRSRITVDLGVRSGEEKIFGVTEPISRNPPTAEDLASSEKLVAVLTSFNLFESQEESEHRQEVLGKLNIIIKEWIREVSLKHGHSESTASEAGGKLCTFGYVPCRAVRCAIGYALDGSRSQHGLRA